MVMFPLTFILDKNTPHLGTAAVQGVGPKFLTQFTSQGLPAYDKFVEHINAILTTNKTRNISIYPFKLSSET